MAATTGIDFDFADGVDAKAMPPMIRFSGSSAGVEPGYLASRRAHMNILRRQVLDDVSHANLTVRSIVHGHVSTALILEDDVDWDMRIRNQMDSLHHMMSRNLAGNEWDVLWLGHMGDAQVAVRFESSHSNDCSVRQDDHRSISYLDETVPIIEDRSPGFNDRYTFPDKTRVVHMSDFPLCTFGYAVSLQGARKILFRMEQEIDTNYDTDLANHCRTGLDCLSVTPPLFHEDDKQNRASSDTSNGNTRDQGMKVYKTFTNSTREYLRDIYGADHVHEQEWLDTSQFTPRFMKAKGQD
ncbi:Hypothetical protein D9617_30g011550 [Elsinoe fawcettii]|nr:Hypothetical protein D9617_30g011550 [Elsinoe fawcettii]